MLGLYTFKARPKWSEVEKSVRHIFLVVSSSQQEACKLARSHCEKEDYDLRTLSWTGPSIPYMSLQEGELEVFHAEDFD